jgi:xanthine dehydrogenase molybdopterin-binding subunit B
MNAQNINVTVFKGTQNETKLQDQINSWLTKNQRIVEVIDIKYGYGFGFSGPGYSAMAIYRLK